MFNRTFILPTHNRTEYVTREVHEHRAPTDDSVKLLREMEAKAQEQIIEAVHVGDTTFECVLHQCRQPLDDSRKWLAVFSLNGKKLTAEFEWRDWQIKRQDAALGLLDAIAKTIANEVLTSALMRFEAVSLPSPNRSSPNSGE